MRFRDLPVAARAYIAAVMCGGAVLAAISVSRGGFSQPLMLLSFVAASFAVHTIKVTLPVGTSYSTLSLGFAITFASLLVLGPAATVWTMIVGGWAQCTINVKTPNPWYRTAFSMSALSLSMEMAGQTLGWTGGRNLDGPADIVIPSIVASALIYFLANSVLMAVVIGITSRRSIVKVWDQDFLWGAPNYFIGALAATVAVQSVTRYGLQAIVLLVGPLYLAFRLYKAYLDRVGDMARTNQELHTMYERAHAESLTDPLTELPNRRFLVSHAFNELARARREGYEVAFLIVDLDAFKSINDLHGHHQGDAALRTVASCLRNGLRSYDVCGRYAGDEFVLILSRCNAALAEKRATELAEALANRPADGEYPADRQLTLSIGAAIFPADGASFEELIANADSRMYARKHRRSTAAASARVM
ncbi:MAG: hypothetical protein DMG04_18890 [Acidobacteria bacterium]|nr:MAG: hypothetical protein DMG04_18890 [Acidobacteriota bacterium]PYQ84754.1 MAG: hypothetical protein DMG03_10240 [Acidobacteriota bacterium]PYR09705.1 MAG: hypothetical protein DMF99_14175 [Acidobacteriota bacterium]